MFTNDINKRGEIELTKNTLLNRKKNSIDTNVSHCIIQRESLRINSKTKFSKRNKESRQDKNYDSNRSQLKKNLSCDNIIKGEDIEPINIKQSKATVVKPLPTSNKSFGSYVDSGYPKCQTINCKYPNKIDNNKREDIEAGDSDVNKPKDFGENILAREITDTNIRSRMKENIMNSATRKIDVKTKIGHDRKPMDISSNSKLISNERHFILECIHSKYIENCTICSVDVKYSETKENCDDSKRKLVSNHIKSKASIEKLNAQDKIKVSDENEMDENSCLFEDIEMPASKIPEILANRK